ncbi:hypothetical protein F511_11180 [Dorcoceras hygrometricum]|uniref:Uncharacterized protein n=1 Tax=Dorcoceras hygrometricum TaxID=472368 RepID=A0A2Z7B9A5_9LAMI|nr:hypothetical protein F511_11180 [Dorcoceras hygrometricum]
MREFRVTSFLFGKPIVKVKRRRFVKSVVKLEKKPAATQTSSDANSAATQIQQRRKFSSDAYSAATIQQRKFTFSDADFIFSTKLQNSSSLAQIQIFGPLMADARLPHLCAYKYQRTTTEFLTPFLNSQSEKQHFFATKCCGNSSRFLAKILRKLRRSPGVLLPDFSPCTVTIQRVRDLGRFRAIDLLPKLRTKISDFVLPDFTRKLE